MEPNKNLKEHFFEREFEEVEDGYYDERGFYTTPNGSFWDDDYVFFNHQGYDIHGGSYDKYGIYLPGPGWNEEYNCYEDEMEKHTDSKVYTELLDNLKNELIDNYFETQEVLINDDIEMEEGNKRKELLTEEQMKQIFEDAIQREV